MPSQDDIASAYADEFPVTANHIYLNHAAVAPWPKRTAEAVAAFARENTEHGAAHYPRWMETEKRLRELGTRLINAPSTDDIALLKNTSEGLSVVAYGLDWKPGNNIVGIHQEFPSNRVVWESLGDQGVEFRALDLSTTEDPEASLESLCDANTRLLAVSAVQFSNGLRLDLERLGAFCKDNNILFCVDAIQQIGALSFDVQKIQADFVIADGHKWMLGAEGLALFYAHPESRDRLKIYQFGWHMRRHAGDYEPGTAWEISDTATRFECGSPNMLGIHALVASLELLEAIGIDNIASAIDECVRRIMDWSKNQSGFECLSPMSESRRSGIVTVKHHKIPPEVLYERLKEHQVVTAVRGGGLRLSPHCYTPMAQIGQVCDLLEQAAKTG